MTSNPPTRVIINNTVSASSPTSSSFTVLSATIKEEVVHPLSPKRTTATTFGMNTNKRPGLLSKSPGMAKKRQRLATNNPVHNLNANSIRDSTGQNEHLPSMDEIVFFDKVISVRRKAIFAH